jgi:hypothetical protein
VYTGVGGVWRVLGDKVGVYRVLVAKFKRIHF